MIRTSRVPLTRDTAGSCFRADSYRNSFPLPDTHGTPIATNTCQAEPPFARWTPVHWPALLPEQPHGWQMRLGQGAGHLEATILRGQVDQQVRVDLCLHNPAIRASPPPPPSPIQSVKETWDRWEV